MRSMVKFPRSHPLPFQSVVFDLDGTLLNTLADIASAGNAVLQSLGFEPHPCDDYRQFIGEGVARLFERALPGDAANPNLVKQCVQAFDVHYAEHWNVESQLYDGIADMLDSLTAQGAVLGVLSNKPDPFTQQCVNFYLDRWQFRAVTGQREGVPRKPAAEALLRLTESMNVPVETCLYVGDTSVDMQTAVSAGAYPLGIAWGFRPASELVASGAAAIAETPEQIAERFAQSTTTSSSTE